MTIIFISLVFSFLVKERALILHFANFLLSQLVHVSLESYEYTNSVNFAKKKYDL